MITPDLIEYIKTQLNKNISKDLIIQRLEEAGWRMEDIEEGITEASPAKVEIKVAPVQEEKIVIVDNYKETPLVKEEIIKKTEEPTEPLEIKKAVDPYRELPDGTEPVVAKEEVKSTPTSSLDLLKIWVPTTIKPKNEEIKIEPEVKIEAEVKKEPEIKPEIKIEPEAEIEYIGEPEKTEATPSLSEMGSQNQIQIESTKTEVGSEAISSIPIIELNKLNLPIIENKQPDASLISAFNPMLSGDTSSLSSEIKQPEEKTIVDDFIPTINKSPFSKPIAQTILEPQKLQPIKSNIVQNGMSDILPRNAMISSYSQALLSSTKEKEEIVSSLPKKHKFLKFVVILFVISLISGMIFAFVEGYLKIPGSNFSFSVVKKDPQAVMMEAPFSISKLKSYKVETNINISSPSLSNISIGLSSGKVVDSADRDSVSIIAKGSANHVDDKLLFDYLLNFKSSILKNEIISNWKYDGSDLHVSVPDTSEIFKKDAPKPTIISMKPNDIGLIEGELSPSLQNIIKKIDIYNILSNDVPLYVKNETSSILKEFITGLQYTEKGEESIHGVDTYHYEMSTDRQSTKKLLSSLVDLFVMELPADQKKNLDEALGASAFSSFDVWVGKNDDNLYQIKFTLNAPLSKVLGLNDSGIAGNEVKLDWTTTYYDLNVDNKIVMPDEQVNMQGFIKNIRDIKIKNTISAFKPQANSLRNAIGSYGNRSNPAGSCTNPNPGSLFSPQGHPRSAEGAISSISSSMIALLSETNGAGSCYSTSGAWALSAPLATSSDSLVPNPNDVNYFYCTDSSGNTKTLSAPITGVECK